jgi:O-antigen ligase
MLAPAAFFAGMILDSAKKQLPVIAAIASAAASLFLFYQLLKNPETRPYSFFGNPIFFAEFIAINFPLALHAARNSGPARWLSYAAALLCFFAIILSGSRGPLISLVVSCVFYFFYMLRLEPAPPRILLARAATAAGFALISALFLSLNPVTSSALRNSVDRAAGFFSQGNRAVLDRVLIAKTGLAMAANSPVFGNGAGSFRYMYQEYQSKELKKDPAFSFVATSYGHSDFIQLLAEFGAFGLLLYILFFLSLLYRFDSRARSQEHEEYALNLALAASLLCFFIEGFFNFPLFVMPSAGLFWLYAGLLHGTDEPKKSALPFGFSRVFFSAAAVIAGLALAVTVRQVYSDFYLRQGVSESVKKSNFEMDYFSRAIQLDPGSYYAHFYSAYFYSRKRDFEKSAWHYQRALDIYPASADALYNIGVCMRMTGDMESAGQYFSRAIDLYPGFAMARLSLGKTYLDLGREEEGLKEIALSKKLDPSYEDIEMKNYVESFVEATWEKVK